MTQHDNTLRYRAVIAHSFPSWWFHATDMNGKGRLLVGLTECASLNDARRLGVSVVLDRLALGVTVALITEHHSYIRKEEREVNYYRLHISRSDEHGWYLSDQEGEGDPPVWRPKELSWLPLWGYVQEAVQQWVFEHSHQGSTTVVMVDPQVHPKPKERIRKVIFEPETKE